MCSPAAAVRYPMLTSATTRMRSTSSDTREVDMTQFCSGLLRQENFFDEKLVLLKLTFGVVPLEGIWQESLILIFPAKKSIKTHLLAPGHYKFKTNYRCKTHTHTSSSLSPCIVHVPPLVLYPRPQWTDIHCPSDSNGSNHAAVWHIQSRWLSWN